jgi:GNAT superfamily N-acetyltransferase
MRPTPRVILGRETEYARAKGLLNAARHPTFIGRHTVTRAAKNGGMHFWQVDERDIAVSIVNAKISSLLVLSVLPSMRGQGVGRHIVGYLKPNFVRSLESAVPFFERLGYVGFGTWKQGQRFRTRIMVREGLRGLAGRFAQLERETQEGAVANPVDAQNLRTAFIRQRIELDALDARDARVGKGGPRSHLETDDLADIRQARASPSDCISLDTAEDV